MLLSNLWRFEAAVSSFFPYIYISGFGNFFLKSFNLVDAHSKVIEEKVFMAYTGACGAILISMF